MTIKVSFDYPPIPIRSFDWSAYVDDTYDGPGCPLGHGPTEAAAISDLYDQMEDEEINALGPSPPAIERMW